MISNHNYIIFVIIILFINCNNFIQLLYLASLLSTEVHGAVGPLTLHGGGWDIVLIRFIIRFLIY